MAEQNKPSLLRVIVQLVIVVFLAPFIPMIISGDWNWWEGWAYAAASILSFVISRIIVARIHPDLIAERARFMDAKDTKPWDKVLAPLVGIGPILILAVAGLDKYHTWTGNLSNTLNLTALLGLLIGYGISSWAVVENRFFSGTVRIQSERGHRVVSTGPYRIVRHPGYAGGLLGFLFIPLLLDSWWAFVPTVLLGILLVIRTALEDRTLQEELPGYTEYMKKTRHRLFPGVW